MAVSCWTGIENMAKKLPYTPNSLIKTTLQRLFMWSRERKAVMKGAICSICGSTDNLQCHHPKGINWARIIKVIREEIWPDDLTPLCKKHHDIETKKQKEMSK